MSTKPEPLDAVFTIQAEKSKLGKTAGWIVFAITLEGDDASDEQIEASSAAVATALAPLLQGNDNFRFIGMDTLHVNPTATVQDLLQLERSLKAQGIKTVLFPNVVQGVSPKDTVKELHAASLKRGRTQSDPGHQVPPAPSSVTKKR